MMPVYDLHTLDRVYIAINALGGFPLDEADHHYCRAIDDALDVLEQLGAMDPQDRLRRETAAIDAGITARDGLIRRLEAAE